MGDAVAVGGMPICEGGEYVIAVVVADMAKEGGPLTAREGDEAFR